MRPPKPDEQLHIVPDVSLQLVKIEAKLDAQLGVLKDSVGEIKKDVKQIQEHVQYINAISKIGSRVLLSGGVIAICLKYLASFF